MTKISRFQKKQENFEKTWIFQQEQILMVKALIHDDEEVVSKLLKEDSSLIDEEYRVLEKEIGYRNIIVLTKIQVFYI